MSACGQASIARVIRAAPAKPIRIYRLPDRGHRVGQSAPTLVTARVTGPKSGADRAMESKPPQDRERAFHADRIFSGELGAPRRATMKKSVLHTIAAIVAVMSVGAAAVATDALGRDRHL
jgi:hypothetical protein